MSVYYLQKLMQELENSREWPIDRESRYRRDLRLYQALRESEHRELTPIWYWDTEGWIHMHREWILDPLAERIPEVWAEMLFGEEPELSPAVKADQDQLDSFLDLNDFFSQLQWAEQLASSEGEAWARLVSDPELGATRLEWHSRLQVVPYFVGRQLRAVAFYECYDDDSSGDYNNSSYSNSARDNREWVYVEYHCDGWIANRLYYHECGKGLGNPVPLTERDETAELRADWMHGLPMLAQRFVNELRGDWRCGRSDYKGIASLLLALNEVANIGQSNLRLTGKQRAVIPERFLTAWGDLPQGEEIIIATEVDTDPDKIKNEFAQIVFEFNADQLKTYKDDLVDTILTRSRIAPPLVGKGIDSAQTGPALRARLLDSVLAAQDKGKEWDDKLPGLIQLCARLEKIPVAQGGLGKSWSQVEKPPVIKRQTSLPQDEESVARIVVMETTAGLLSRRTAIARANPTWSDQRIDDELNQIKTEAKDLPPVPGSRTANSLTGENGLVDPASQVSRRPGEPSPTSVPDPQRQVRT